MPHPPVLGAVKRSKSMRSPFASYSASMGVVVSLPASGLPTRETRKNPSVGSSVGSPSNVIRVALLHSPSTETVDNLGGPELQHPPTPIARPMMARRRAQIKTVPRT